MALTAPLLLARSAPGPIDLAWTDRPQSSSSSDGGRARGWMQPGALRLGPRRGSPNRSPRVGCWWLAHAPLLAGVGAGEFVLVGGLHDHFVGAGGEGAAARGCEFALMGHCGRFGLCPLALGATLDAHDAFCCASSHGV